tara:strand:+ start:74368 stop:77838 length:3471 start_codon:yes stop_codon:yes gene_type:complete
MNDDSATINNKGRIRGRYRACLRRIIVRGFVRPAGVVTLIAVSAALTNPRSLCADDRAALSAIFAEQHVQATALDVHRKAMKLPLDDRYDFLSDWVLPGKNHESLRIQIGFTQTNPSPVSEDYLVTIRDEDLQSRQSSGGELVSPAWDLVDVAKQTQQLSKLRQRVEAWRPDSQTDGRLAQAAMLTLIDIAAGGSDAAASSVEEFLKASTANPVVTGPTPAEFLVFIRGVHFEPIREVIAECVNRYQPWMNAEFYRSTPTRHFKSAHSQLRLLQLTSRDEPMSSLSAQPLDQWSVVTRSLAQTRGTGSPTSRWEYKPGLVENVASHDDDFLFFNTPLRGNFEVECDVSGFGWRDSHLMVAGTWIAPVYTHKGYDLGNFRGTRPRREISPPLTKTKHWIHYRTVVRDQVVSTYFNGRLIHQGMVSVDHDPWIAIRSTSRHDGAVQNLRITGQPEIPNEINLSADSNLDGWLSYYDNRVGGQNAAWQHVRSSDDGEIIGNRISRPGGFVISLLNAFNNSASSSVDTTNLSPHQERLLRYHRPMLEDGTIEYDFFYSPGHILTHPALDRLAFLLRPDGVKIHWITDGEFDRSNLNSNNVFDESENRRGPETLPLKIGDWNRLQIRLTGDTVSLVLNGEAVYERALEVTNQRTFGLFHFADESQARVRNIVWKGDWPQALPPLAKQELAVDDTGFLDRDAEPLTSVFEHDFASDGLPLEQFVILRGDPKVHVRHVQNGLLETRPGTGGYRNAAIAPRLMAHGDFDVIATYRDFKSTAAEGGNGNAMLLAILDNATADESLITRRHIHRTNNVHENVSQCVQVENPVTGERRDYFGVSPMEESSGRLRLARRGGTMYFLTAEEDSPHFVLRSQRETATDDIQSEGLRLLTQIFELGGDVSVVWSHLIVRAESLSGRAVEDFDSQLAQLNKERDQLKSRFEFDFTKQAPPDSLIQRWTDQNPWSKDDGGLLMTAPGTDNWSSAGANVMKSVSGDFDISISFEVQKFDIPKSGKRCSAYLQLDLPDKNRTQVSNIFTNNDTGATEVVAQVREPRGNGQFNYRATGALDLDNVTTLRIARRAERLTFLTSTKDSSNERIVGYLDRPAVPLPKSSIRFLVHTGGADRESIVLWKSIGIRADDIPDEDDSAAKPTDSQKLILDFFK